MRILPDLLARDFISGVGSVRQAATRNGPGGTLAAGIHWPASFWKLVVPKIGSRVLGDEQPTPHFDVKHLLGNAIFLISNCHLLGNEKSRRSKTGRDSFLMVTDGCVVCGAGASGAEPGGAVHAERGHHAGHDAHRPGGAGDRTAAGEAGNDGHDFAGG